MFVTVLTIALQLSLESYTEFSLSTMMLSKLLQPVNASSPIEVTELGITTEVKLLQPVNAYLPIEVTELGISTDVKLLQPEKAETPIEVTELGISTDVKLLHL